MDARQDLHNWIEEKRARYLYEVIADVEVGTNKQALFLKLAETAERQANLWVRSIEKSGNRVPERYEPDFRTKLVGRLAQWLGPRAIRPVLAAMKVRGLAAYSSMRPGHPMPVALGDVGGRHKAFGSGGNLRAAVFGINDGLVSNASLIMGIAGASADRKIILLTGIAGLLAGAFSMAGGEYVSVRSQRDLHEYQIGLEREELEEYPKEEAAELALIYEAKGIQQEEAKNLADTIIADPERALDTLAREELGLNPDELGSPWGAAFSSFISFALGASIPLWPFFFTVGKGSMWAVVVLTAISLFAVGAVLSLFTGKRAILGGLRMLLIGGSAAGATFLIGKAIGSSLG